MGLLIVSRFKVPCVFLDFSVVLVLETHMVRSTCPLV